MDSQDGSGFYWNSLEWIAKIAPGSIGIVINLGLYLVLALLTSLFRREWHSSYILCLKQGQK